MRRTTIKEEKRSKKKEKIKSMVDKMEFAKTADDLRHKDKRLGCSPRVSVVINRSI